MVCCGFVVLCCGFVVLCYCGLLWFCCALLCLRCDYIVICCASCALFFFVVRSRRALVISTVRRINVSPIFAAARGSYVFVSPSTAALNKLN